MKAQEKWRTEDVIDRDDSGEESTETMSSFDNLLPRFELIQDALDRIRGGLTWPVDHATAGEITEVFAEVEAKLAGLLAELSGKGLIT